MPGESEDGIVQHEPDSSTVRWGLLLKCALFYNSCKAEGRACELPRGPACMVAWREVYSVVVRNVSRFTFDQKPREELWIQTQQTPRPAC